MMAGVPFEEALVSADEPDPSGGDPGRGTAGVQGGPQHD